MKRLVLLSTLVFWIAMSAIWLFGWLRPSTTSQDESIPSRITSETKSNLTSVAEHGTPESCWLIIDKRDYDVTSYIEQHPADPRTILQYCGGDATQAFATKDHGRPHSAYARRLLDQYLIGTISPE